MNKYEDIFTARGNSYHEAMEMFPDARDEEFQTTISFLPSARNMTLLDLPSGGGYLRKYLPGDRKYIGYDFSSAFAKTGDQIALCSESHIDLQDETIDEVISLAAHHHISDRPGFYKQIYRVLKTKGYFILGDGLKGSKQHLFLNGFVNQWNSMGHKGRFLDFDHDLEPLEKVGFSLSAFEETFHWNFMDIDACMLFFRKLFHLDLHPSDSDLINEIENLGLEVVDKQVKVNWKLGYIIGTKS